MPQDRLDLSSLPSLSSTIAALGLSARKSLGQHFLLDSAITDDIVRYAGSLQDCHIIEIGPGPGGLTRSLLKAGVSNLHVVEKDERCLRAMQQLGEATPGRLHICHADALEVDLLSIVPAPRKIVANLPYNAGTPMLMQWMHAVAREGPSAFISLTLMFQKEVAERITAAHGSKAYGRLSVLCQWLCECRYDMELPPEAFSPPPKVESAVVTLIPRARPLVDVSVKTLEIITAKAFGQRRKMLRQSLKGLNVSAEDLLNKVGIDPTLRIEQLDAVTLCRLAKVYQDLISASNS